MKHIKQHIAFKITTFIIVASLVLPSVVKFSHIFAHHEHEVCLGENQSHFHEIDMDCEFYKFNINYNAHIDIIEYNIKNSDESTIKITAYYSFLKSHQRLANHLRGPPLLM